MADGFPWACPAVYNGVDPELTAGGDHARGCTVWSYTTSDEHGGIEMLIKTPKIRNARSYSKHLQ